MTHALVRWIDDNPDKLVQHMPAGWTAEVAKRGALAILQADKKTGGKIAKCTPESLVLAILQAASYGLQLDTSDAYIIPYGGEATLSIGWRGMVKLAKRGGELTDIEAEVVYPGERFVASRGTDPTRHGLIHEISIDRAGELRAVYALITLADGSKTFEIMSREDVDAVRAVSKAPNSPAWKNWFGEMGKKAVIRRALKRFSMTAEVASIIANDEALHIGEARVNGSGLVAQDLNDRLLGPPDSQQTTKGAPALLPSPLPDASSGAPAVDIEASDAVIVPTLDDLNPQGVPIDGELDQVFEAEAIRKEIEALFDGCKGPTKRATAKLLKMSHEVRADWIGVLSESDDRAEVAREIMEASGES